jgi:hypothetical protein
MPGWSKIISKKMWNIRAFFNDRSKKFAPDPGIHPRMTTQKPVARNPKTAPDPTPIIDRFLKKYNRKWKIC